MHATINTVEPYLFFEGRCDEAFEFYRKALNAEVTALMRFKDSPDPSGCAPGSQDKVMHANLRIGGTTIMASDGRCSGKADFKGFALTLNVPTEEEAQRRFAALADGGQVHMPLAKTFFATKFGMVADRFGVLWMVIMMPQNAGTGPGLRIEHAIDIKASPRIVWKALLDEISTKMVGADGKSKVKSQCCWKNLKGPATRVACAAA